VLKLSRKASIKPDIDVTTSAEKISVKQLRKAFSSVEEYWAYVQIVGTKEEKDHFDRLKEQLSMLLDATSPKAGQAKESAGRGKLSPTCLSSDM
jgi:hypothetical protein